MANSFRSFVFKMRFNESAIAAVPHEEQLERIHRYPGADKPYLYKMDSIGLAVPTAMKDAPVFQYFSAVANARRDRAESGGIEG